MGVVRSIRCALSTHSGDQLVAADRIAQAQLDPFVGGIAEMRHYEPMPVRSGNV